MNIRAMTISDYEEVLALWQITSKRALSRSDERDQIDRFLSRNEGLSQVAVEDEKIIGTVLAGHDGRRGFLYHMAVLPQYRRKGIGEKLAKTALEQLKEQGIEKTRIFVFIDNFTGQGFWYSLGFSRRHDLYTYAYDDTEVPK